MKNAYQRRRVKARVEKRARMMKLDAITLDFARQVIEEETGAPLEIQARRAAGATRAPAAAAAEGPGRGQRGQAHRARRRKNPLISTFEWTDDAVQRVFRVPAGFMRNKTQERIEELARERGATAIDLALVEEGIEIGKRMMAEMMATYSARDAGARARRGAGVRAVRGGLRHAGQDAPRRRWRLPQRGAIALSRAAGPARTQAKQMAAYRFCRTDDIALLVDALNRCWAPYQPDEPPMTRDAFKRSIRDLQVWCSSCMVAFSGPDPVGVLIGAKRPSGTLVHQIAVHPDHRRHGHGRHLLASLGSKLSILGPPRMVAEIPETHAPACELFSASGYVQEARLTDYVLQRDDGERGAVSRHDGRFVIPVTVDDLAANGLLGEADPQVVLGALGRDPRRRERTTSPDSPSPPTSASRRTSSIWTTARSCRSARSSRTVDPA